MSAFELALERGADAIELDVHATSDGIAVVHHDPIVDGRPIASTSWRNLSEVTLGKDSHIPRLRDVLTIVGTRATVYIEIKGAGCEAQVIRVAREFGQRYALHSFDHEAIERARSIDPNVSRGALIDRGATHAARQLPEMVHRLRIRDVWPHFSLVDADFMAAAAMLGLRVIPWTVNSNADAQRFAAMGVAGICTDDVRLIANP
jgi:glycerophosphoryl diester phosphodiesterase